MFHEQVDPEGLHQGETKCIPTTNKIRIHCFKTHSTIEDLQKFGESDDAE